MEFFLDVDGVILDFESTFMEYVRDHYLPDLPSGFVPTSWDLDDGPLAKLDVDVAWDAFMASGQFGQLKLLADPKSFNQISGRSSVHLVTNLPEAHYQERIENLERYGLKFSSLNMGGHHDFGIKDYPSKAQVIDRIRDTSKGMVFLDDHPENCRVVKAQFPTAQVYLMQRPHNLNTPDEGWVRVLSWAEFAGEFAGELT